MKYKDLSIEAKQVALEHHSNNAADYEWDEDIKADWVEKLESVGIYTDINSITWTGFWSQGDGASFTGSINLKEFLEAHPDIKNNNRALYITTIPFNGEAQCDWYIDLNKSSSRYHHEHTVGIDVSDRGCTLTDEDEMESLWVDAEEEILDQCRRYMKDIYRALETEYEYITGEEALIERDADYAEDGQETICFGEFL
jgi:hypothetical protein